METTPLAGRVSLVTGSSRGIGRGIALALAEAGSTIAVNYRERERQAEDVVDEIRALGGTAAAFKADVSQADEVGRMVAAVTAELGAPSIVVNNAGVGQRLADVGDLDLALWQHTIDVNVTSAFLVTSATLPAMRAEGWGRIINISSTAAQTGGSIGPHYAASKAALIGLTHGYASLLVKQGITVNAIAMAQIETELVHSATPADTSRIPVGRFGTADECGAVAVLLANNGYMTGQTISINGGMYYTS